MNFSKDELRFLHVMFCEYKEGIYKDMRRKNLSYQTSKFLKQELQDLLDLESKFEEYDYKTYGEN